ncbi:MAG: hypothetical protein EXR66_00030 [Dehalococcoidia bacterium]|nr:hypothetical protein [Dehalococcoidia bacterium]
MLGKLFVFGLLATGAYLGARKLIDDPGIIEELPEAAREPVHELRERLIDLDALIREVLADVTAERRSAEEQLHEEYLNRVRPRGTQDAPVDPSAPASPFATAPQAE